MNEVQIIKIGILSTSVSSEALCFFSRWMKRIPTKIEAKRNASKNITLEKKLNKKLLIVFFF